LRERTSGSRIRTLLSSSGLRAIAAIGLCVYALAVVAPWAHAQSAGGAPSGDPAATTPNAADSKDSFVAPLDPLIRKVTPYLSGQTITVGGGYTINKFSVYKLKGIPQENLGNAHLADVTDNGTFSPFVDYASAEKPLASAPLATGVLTLGYNFAATYSTFNVNRELVDNPFQGEDFGTHVQGDYVLAGAALFAKLGPLFPESQVFWRVGLGAGGALLRYSGNVEVRQGVHFGEVHNVSGQADVLRPYTTLYWDLQFGRWLVSFRTMTISAAAGSEQTGLERDSLYLAYRFEL
jgi:hypothetical protein